MTTKSITLDRPRTGLFAALTRWLGGPAAARRRRPPQRVELAELDPRLLYDIGIEPMDVADAIKAKRRSFWLFPLRQPD